MISEKSKTLFAEIFIYLARGEKKLEVIRQVLCEIPEFEPYTAFKRMALSNKNFLTPNDLLQFLSENEVFYSDEIIADTFLSHYDYDSDGKLCYAELLRALLPGDNPVLRTDVSQRPIGRLTEKGRLKDSVEYTLSKLINEEIMLYLESEPHKRLLQESESFSYALLFSIIDKADSGFIDFTNLNEFFESQGLYPYEEELISILKRLDKDDDGRITFEEFKNGLLPKNLRTAMTNSSFLGSKILMSPSHKPSEKRMMSPPKNYPFEAIRKGKSPPRNPSTSKLNTSLRVKSPLTRNKFESSLKSSSKKSKREESLPKEEKSIQELKREIKRELNQSKRFNNSPAIKKTPDKNQRKIFKSFHQEIATDSKISYKLSNTQFKSPVPKKNSFFDSMKKSVEKELEISKQIHQSFSKKSDRLINSLNKMSHKFSPRILESPKFRKNHTEIVDFFKKIIIFEREIERVKQDLALRPDFNLMDFFAIFDKNEKGYINQNEIKLFLDTMGIVPNNDSFPLFLKRFDRNNFGRFKFCDFVEIFTPSQTDYADLLKQRKPVNYDSKFSAPEEMLSSETRKVVNDLLSRIIVNEREIENERKVLVKLIGNQMREIFEAIDLNKNGVLSLKEIKIFLEAHEFFITERDASNLFARFDHYKKGSISFTEFLQELQQKL